MDRSQINSNDQLNDIKQQDQVVYICGGCGQDVYFNPKEDVVICKGCGYRILYKKRARTIMQYEAR